MTVTVQDSSPAELPWAAPRLDATAALLRTFRAAVPNAGGIVVATEDGDLVAHDLPGGEDARFAARTAAWERRLVAADAAAKGKPMPASAFVDGPEGLTLVVFLGRDTLAADLGPTPDLPAVAHAADGIVRTFAS